MTAATATPDLSIAWPAFDVTVGAAAHRHTSFVPERRGQEEAAMYENHLTNVYRGLLEYTKSDEHIAVVKTLMAEYALGYRDRLYIALRARGNTASTMITGGSNFNHRQNQKRMATADERMHELNAWSEVRIAQMKKLVLAAHSPEQVADAEWAKLEKTLNHDLDFIIGYDEGRVERWYNRGAWVTSICERLARQSKNGKHALVIKGLDLIAARQEGRAKPLVTPRNKVWALRAVAEAALAAPPPAPEETAATTETYNGIDIIMNHPIDRVQIFFPGKPDAATIAKLKGAGWNWSPRNGAWQRKLTNAAEYSARQIVGYP